MTSALPAWNARRASVQEVKYPVQSVEKRERLRDNIRVKFSFEAFVNLYREVTKISVPHIFLFSSFADQDKLSGLCSEGKRSSISPVKLHV